MVFFYTEYHWLIHTHSIFVCEKTLLALILNMSEDEDLKFSVENVGSTFMRQLRFPTAKCTLLSDGLGISPLQLVVGFVLFLQSENIIKQLYKNWDINTDKASDTKVNKFSTQNYKFPHVYNKNKKNNLPCFYHIRHIFRKTVVLDKWTLNPDFESRPPGGLISKSKQWNFWKNLDFYIFKNNFLYIYFLALSKGQV